MEHTLIYQEGGEGEIQAPVGTGSWVGMGYARVVGGIQLVKWLFNFA